MKAKRLIPVLLVTSAVACAGGSEDGSNGGGGGNGDASVDSAGAEAGAGGAGAGGSGAGGDGVAAEGGSSGATAGGGGDSEMDAGGGQGAAGETGRDAGGTDGAMDGWDDGTGAAADDAAVDAGGDAADGGAGDAADDAAVDAGGDAADGGGDVTPPTVASVTPLDSATGVTSDTSIVITFSEPMDTASVASAYESTDLPTADATWIWSNGDTVLTIDPDAPLPYATGTDPSATSAQVIAYSLSTAAADKAGNPMAASFSASFSTLRHITQTLTPAASLRGHVRDDGDVTGVIFVGDTNFNRTNRGFVSYPLANVPDGITSFQSATLTLTETEVQGSPYSDLGTLRLRSIEYGALDMTAYNASYTLDIAVPDSGSEKNLDVLSFVQADLTDDHTYSQYRLEYTTLTDSDNAFDYVIFSSTAPLVLDYLIP